eukprot:Rhum_TRINITY_DN13828_c0_g1::Rhum_TRINITY_DN13828_c0_g1_i1::g.64863::m.64863/K02134/ATPeF1D, ATP5D, ATP16; F-type H+-transporting ATPase subunit delta
MFRRGVPALFAATRTSLARSLPNGFDYTTAPTDVAIAATVEQPTELLLTLTRQDEFLKAAEVVKDVTLTTSEGVMGVLPGHEYVVEKLIPGILEVTTTDGKAEKYAVSGGFAHVNTDGSVDIQTAEVIPLEHLDLANCEKELASATELSKSSDADAATRGSIAVEMMTPIVAALKA